VNAPAEVRLAELFVRYWDGALTPAEADELNRLLSSDPAAREWFQVLSLQAVTAAELRVVPREPDRAAEPARAAAEPAAPGRLHRRRALAYLGGALAASVGGIALGRWVWPDGPGGAGPDARGGAGPDRSIRLGGVRGAVAVRSPGGEQLPADGPIPPGSTVTTTGPSASAVLFYPNGTNVALTEDTAVTLGTGADELRVEHGVIAADVRPPLVGDRALSLTTASLVLTGGAVVTLYHSARATEVGVQNGSVTVSAPTGRALGEVHGGELLTVGGDGGLRKQPIRETAGDYALDLSRPLVPEWAVGTRGTVGARSALVPEFWHDPYHGRQMYQIRSDKQWVRGFFRLERDSLIRVRYRAEREGRGQVCFCVRKADIRLPDTGMLEWNGIYRPASSDAQDGLQTIEVRAGAMLDNRHAPRFDPPWFGFLYIFNTYEIDLGLRVAEFRVTPPGPAGG
jgi:ferric-dicitrate binding protein FerR (iron transport regulator)